MLKFDFLEKVLGIFLYQILCMIFQQKGCTFYIQFSLPLLLEILGNMCIAIVCFAGSNVISFKINLIFLIELFFYITKKSRQKFKYLENEKNFEGEIKSIFYQF